MKIVIVSVSYRNFQQTVASMSNRCLLAAPDNELNAIFILEVAQKLPVTNRIKVRNSPGSMFPIMVLKY